MTGTPNDFTSTDTSPPARPAARPAARRIPFVFVDVFADAPLTGNPLALVPDADDLSDDTMRAIAREFNQSETTFLTRPTADGATWRLRSFTAIGAEVLGAGHNAMGAWIWLAESGRLDAADGGTFAQQIGDAVLPVRTSRADGRIVVTMDQSTPAFGATITESPESPESARELARALGVERSDIGGAEVVSTGAGHLLVALRNRGVVDGLAPDRAALSTVLRESGGEGCYVYSLDPLDPAGGSVAYARFFNPTVGIVEDPATGTAAGPLAALLARDGLIAQGAEVVVEQGYALGRPSRLRLSVTGALVRLSGSGLTVASGELHL